MLCSVSSLCCHLEWLSVIAFPLLAALCISMPSSFVLFQHRSRSSVVQSCSYTAPWLNHCSLQLMRSFYCMYLGW